MPYAQPRLQNISSLFSILCLMPADLPVAFLGGYVFLEVHSSEDRIFPKALSDTQNCLLPVSLFGEIGFSLFQRFVIREKRELFAAVLHQILLHQMVGADVDAPDEQVPIYHPIKQLHYGFLDERTGGGLPVTVLLYHFIIFQCPVFFEPTRSTSSFFIKD